MINIVNILWHPKYFDSKNDRGKCYKPSGRSKLAICMKYIEIRINFCPGFAIKKSPCH